jgi:hypothetical protein
MDQGRDDPGPQGNGIQPPFSGESGHSGAQPPARGDRLPPPMFPPGSRRLHTRAAPRPPGEEPEGGVPKEALIMPDEPLPWTGAVAPTAPAVSASSPPADEFRAFTPDSAFEEALIDPDAPIVRTTPPRTPEDYEQVMRGAPHPPEDPVVTGIGETQSTWESALEQLALAPGDPHVAELTRMVRKLADGLSNRGEVALKSTPDLTPFEATLRAYCVGFLSRAREGRDR